MTSARSAGHTREQLGRRPTAQAIALVRPLLVVEGHERVEAALHRLAVREVLAPKRDAPVLVEDRPLQPLDEAVGPGMARQGARVPDAQSLAGRGIGGLELGAAVGEDPLQWPPRVAVERHQDLAEEA